MQGESRITSHLHHIATSDIAVSTDVGPGLVLGQEGKAKVFVTFKKKKGGMEISIPRPQP